MGSYTSIIKSVNLNHFSYIDITLISHPYSGIKRAFFNLVSVSLEIV